MAILSGRMSLHLNQVTDGQLLAHAPLSLRSLITSTLKLVDVSGPLRSLFSYYYFLEPIQIEGNFLNYHLKCCFEVYLLAGNLNFVLFSRNMPA